MLGATFILSLVLNKGFTYKLPQSCNGTKSDPCVQKIVCNDPTNGAIVEISRLYPALDTNNVDKARTACNKAGLSLPSIHSELENFCVQKGKLPQKIPFLFRHLTVTTKSWWTRYKISSDPRPRICFQFLLVDVGRQVYRWFFKDMAPKLELRFCSCLRQGQKMVCKTGEFKIWSRKQPLACCQITFFFSFFFNKKGRVPLLVSVAMWYLSATPARGLRGVHGKRCGSRAK